MIPLTLRRHLARRVGWRALATALGFGVLSAAALPPVHAVPVLWLSIPGLLLLLTAAPGHGPAFWRGFAFGLGHHLAGLYWISNALLTEADRFGWLVPLAVPAIALVLALFTSVPVLAWSWLARRDDRPGVGSVLVLAGFLLLGELARGHVLTGFPWNQWGSVWAFAALPLQAAAYVGAAGLGLATLVAAGLAAVPGWRPGLAGLGLLALLGLVGFARLLAPEPAPQPVRLAIVQGNIPQSHKWDDALRAQHFRKYLGLTFEAFRTETGLPGRPVAIWPETASPYLLDTDEVARRLAADTLPEGGVLIAGAPRIERRPDGPQPGFAIWNSLHVIGSLGETLARYDKHHLVPFGEYVPLRRFLPLETVVRGNVDFSAGDGPSTIATTLLPPFSPLICYEIIFPGRVVDPRARPEWLVTITNDAWFGHSAGPYQHLAAARLRAVEEGLPVARAANTGISAIFDARGRIVARLGLGMTGIVHGPLPAALPPTLFARGGESIALLLAGLCVGLGTLWGRGRLKNQENARNVPLYGES